MTVHNCVQNLADLLSSSDKQTVKKWGGAGVGHGGRGERFVLTRLLLLLVFNPKP